MLAISQLNKVRLPFTDFMGRLGFEPRTNRLKAECSTAELATRFLCAAHSFLI